MLDLDTAWSADEGIARATELFTATYGQAPDGVWASPGRVNVIGEHIDYNGGYCLPIALPHRTYVAARRRDDRQVRMVTDFQADQPWNGSLDDLAPGGLYGWAAYAGGPVWALRQDGVEVPGLDLAIASCVPVGAGLSSSAAIECAVGLAAAELADRPLGDNPEDRAQLAALCVRAENEVAGAPTGGLDQAASLRTQDGHALLLDCAANTVEHIGFDMSAHGLCLLVADSRASHALGDGQYGARRAHCEQAAELLGVKSLRETADATDPSQLDEVLATLPEDVLRRRVRHVLTETWRVQDFVAALRAERFEEAGELLSASHASLRDDYEVSVKETDVLVDAALAAGALGSRITGGGFGGSVIALVRADQADQIGQAMAAAAQQHGTPEPQLHLATAAAPGQRMA
ncbi:galactokinase [Luteococcus sp. Sow4_B9]|uniref:galactokinase n=1 Tax=Luteococcus sp. Sow4_B9 TaxID=3438792 RepID=UPI003F996490